MAVLCDKPLLLLHDNARLSESCGAPSTRSTSSSSALALCTSHRRFGSVMAQWDCALSVMAQCGRHRHHRWACDFRCKSKKDDAKNTYVCLGVDDGGLETMAFKLAFVS